MQVGGAGGKGGKGGGMGHWAFKVTFIDERRGAKGMEPWGHGAMGP